MPKDETQLEHRLLQNGCVVLYHNPFLMKEHSCSLARFGWQFKEVYVAETGTAEEFFDQVAVSLKLPHFFGRNLDAFRDCLSEMSFRELQRQAFGLIRFDLVVKRDAVFAHAVLDIFAEVERHCLLDGGRVLFMVQTADPDLFFCSVGASLVVWNFEEWLDSKRKKPDSSAT